MDKEPTRKKILYVITKGNWGGAQRYVYDLATNIDKKKFDVAIAYGEGNTLKDKLTKARIRSMQIQSLGRDIKIGNDFKVFLELIRLFRKEKPDVIHLNSSKIGLLGAVAGRIARVPKIIFTAHGWPFKEDRNFFSKTLIKFLSWLTVIFSHVTIVVSRDDLKKSENFIFCKNKTQLIYNGIGNTLFKDGFQARQHIGTNIRENIWIGTIAELTHNKGIDLLIKAFSEIAFEYIDACLVIIGEGEDKQSLIELAHSLGCEKRIYFLGFIEKASYCLKAFDIFILSSRKEGVPYVILEAGRAALPVISTPIGGVPEIIMHRETGILSSTTNPPDIANAIRYGLQNTEEIKGYGDNLKYLVQTSWNISHMIENTHLLYSHEHNHPSK